MGLGTTAGRYFCGIFPAFFLWGTLSAGAAPQAALVMDARTGAVYAEDNADARLHPASLTKMMTLYLAFEAAVGGGIDLDARTRISITAAAEPGARLGLRAGQEIAIGDLVTAVAIGSANDAATALAEAVAGSEAAFVARMNARAADLGMADTTFRNAHGLTEDGHLSTAHDMTRLARHLAFDFPQFHGLYRQREATVAGYRIRHTNRRFLNGYAGADGIKTGYTAAAGYNLAASARRGDVHLLVTVFGAPSSQVRAARVARLMDAGFARAPAQVTPVPPGRKDPPPHRAVPPLMAARAPLVTLQNRSAARNPGSLVQALPLSGPPPHRDGTATAGMGSVGIGALRR